MARRFDRLLVADLEDVSWLLGSYEPDRNAWLWLASGRWTYVSDRARAGPPWAAVDAARIGELATLVGSRDFSVSGKPPLLPGDLRALCLESGDVLAAVRSTKDAVEQALVADNVARLGAALDAVAPLVHDGCNELELWRALELALGSPDGEPVEWAGNLSSGPRTTEPDPHPMDRAVGAGEPVLLDAYPRIGGYHADLTRTWAYGELQPRLGSAFAGVLAALEVVADHLRPGAVGAELDALARRELERRGQPSDFPHHTGHGFGVKQQEPPWLRPGSTDTIPSGCLVAVEPGCYLPDVGGVRLEQDFLVLADGTLELGPPVASFKLSPS